MLQQVLRDSAREGNPWTGELAGFGQRGVALRRTGDAFHAVDAGLSQQRQDPADGAADVYNERLAMAVGGFSCLR